MSKRNNVLLLQDMLDAGRKIQQYVLGFDYIAFIEDDKTVDAVIRNFEIIGEAANRIEEEVKSDNPQIPWKRLRGFRNRIVHDYMGIDYEIVWEIIENELEKLLLQIETLIRTYPVN